MSIYYKNNQHRNHPMLYILIGGIHVKELRDSRNYVVYDCERYGNRLYIHILEYERFRDNKPSRLDMRKWSEFEFDNEPEIVIVNLSGRNISAVGINDWKATIRTGEAIVSRYGEMEYMGQYSI